MLAVAGAVIASLGLACRFGPTPARPAPVLFAIAIAGGVCALTAAWIGATRGSTALGRPSRTLVAVSVATPLALFAVATFAAGIDGREIAMGGGTLHQHLVCISLTLLFALGPLLAFTSAHRGSDPVHPRALGAALGAAAGAWGGVMIDVHCALTTVEHLALGHVLPIVLASAVGALLGARMLGVRSLSN